MKLIETINNEARVSSEQIAEGVGNNHQSVMKLIDSQLPELEAKNPVRFEIRQGKPLPQGGLAQGKRIALLDERQSALLLTMCKNTKSVVEFKGRLVDGFLAMRNNQLPAIPQTFAEALQLAADKQQEIERKNQLLIATNEASIKAGEILVREFVKAHDFIEIGEKKMFQWLREQGIVSKSNEPFQRYIAKGYFTWKPSEEKHNGKFRYTLRITARGKVWLAAKYQKYDDSLAD